jgi:small subunit ribosomal protein S14
MAKISTIFRNLRRIKQVMGAKKTRDALRETVKKDENNREEASLKLQKRSRNENPVRVRHRCRSCGRARGNYRKFGLCRMCLRNAAMRGDVPGLKKSSW